METIEKDVENCDHKSSAKPNNNNTRKKGGWTAIKYILANETFEKLASMSLIANITLYLREKYHMDGILLVNVVNIWSGSSNFLTIPGALLSDAYLGRFYTLLIGSIANMLGMGAMTLGAAVPQLRPPSCVSEYECSPSTAGQLTVLFMGLILLAIGAGCSRPCNIAFGADQFDTNTDKGRSQLSRFYNWWYFSFTIALLVALTVVVYIQTNVSWTIGFAIPTTCFAFSIVIFLLGCSKYIYKKTQGSIFIDMVKVIVAAYRKRNHRIDGSQKLYDPSIEYDDISMVKLDRTNRLRFFDNAAMICDPSEVDSKGMAVNTWRLCSVQQVEQLKCLLGITPVWIAGIMCVVTMDQQNTFGILQSLQMTRKVGSHFVIPPAWIGFASMVALSVWILIYERVLIPLMRRIKKKDDVRLTLQDRIRIGILMAILCMCFAAVVEYKRREQALKAGSFVSPLHVGFLAPQLVLSGLVEAFAAIACMEFFTAQMPEHMRSIAGSIFFISLAMASYLSTGIVNIIYSITVRHGKAWLGGHDLNHNRLDYFYIIIACLEAVNFFYFTFFASKYVFVGNNTKTVEDNISKKTVEDKNST